MLYLDHSFLNGFSLILSTNFINFLFSALKYQSTFMNNFKLIKYSKSFFNNVTKHPNSSKLHKIDYFRLSDLLEGLEPVSAVKWVDVGENTGH